MNTIYTIAGLLSTIGVGYIILFGFRFLKSYTFWEKIPFAYGLGVGVIAWQLFCYSQLHIVWGPYSLFLPWILLGSSVLMLNKNKLSLTFKRPSFSSIDILLFTLIFLTVLYVGFEVWLRPLSAWDGWAIWLMKSKLFFIDGYVNPHIYAILRDSYPYVINLFGTFLYILMGSSDDTAVLLLFFGFYVMLGSSMYLLLRREGSSITKALLFTFLLLSIQNIIRHGGRYEAGYVDLPLGFYFFSCFSLLLQYKKDTKISTLILLTIFMAITRLLKEEGLIFCLVMEVYLLYVTWFQKKKISHIFLSFLWFLPVIQWELFKQTTQSTFSLYVHYTVYFQRLAEVVFYMVKECFNIQNWNILWLVFFLSIPLFFMTKKTTARLAFFLLLLQVSSYGIVFLISPYTPVVHVTNVMDRLLLHIAPLALFAIAVSI